jgi:hypothetical protein
VVEWGGVPERRRWCRRSPGTVAAVPTRGGSGGEGVLAVAACEGNKNLPSDLGRKAGPEFIVSSIKQRFYVEPLLKLVYQHRLYL